MKLVILSLFFNCLAWSQSRLNSIVESPQYSSQYIYDLVKVNFLLRSQEKSTHQLKQLLILCSLELQKNNIREAEHYLEKAKALYGYLKENKILKNPEFYKNEIELSDWDLRQGRGQ